MRFFIATALILIAAGICAQDRLGDSLPEGAVQRLGTLRMRYSTGIGDLIYLPDGRAAVAAGGKVDIWDTADGQIVESHAVTDASVTGINVSADGTRLLVADSNSLVREYDLTTAEEIRQWPTEQSSLQSAHYSPDETHVLTTGSRPPTIKEWDLDSGDELVSITGKMHYFHEAIYDAAGETACVVGGAGSNEVISQFDLATGEMLKTWLKDYYTHDRSIVLSEDGERILVGSRHSATEWLLSSHEQQGKFTGHHGHAVTAVAYCKEPEQLLTGSRDGSIRRWDRLTGDILLRWFPHEAYAAHIRVSPDGKWVLSYGRGQVAVSSIEDGSPRVAWDRHGGPVQAVATLPGGRCVSGSADSTLRVWDTTTGDALATIGSVGIGAFSVATSADGSRVAAGCKDGIVREYGMPGGELLRELKGHLGYVRSVTYTPKGHHLLSSAGDGTVRVWGAEGDTPTKILEGHRGGVLSVAVSPDGQSALTGGRDATVRLWDLRSGATTRVMEAHRGWVEGVTFTGDGQAVSVARDGRLISWNLATGEPLQEIEAGGALYAIALSADGASIYAGGSGVAGEWDVATGARIRELAGHQGTVFGLAADPETGKVISASQDTTLLVWE